MAESIHGHEVMEMMMASEKGFTKSSLKKAIYQKFGEAARFHTCSAENMTADELIEFLEAREKFVDAGEDAEQGFTTDPSKICDH